MKYDVFISYSRKDTAIADQICAAFDKAGITYFIDRQGIGGGMEFPKILADNILNSQIFLLLASKNSYASPFTDREITFAFNNKKGENMFPYIIDNVPFPKHLELIFSSNNWRFLSQAPIETVLIDDIFSLLGQNPHTKAKAKSQSDANEYTYIEQTPKQRKSIIEEFPEYRFVPTSLLPDLSKKIKTLKKTKRILRICIIIAFVLLFFSLVFYIKYGDPHMSTNPDFIELLDRFFNDNTWYEITADIGGLLLLYSIPLLIIISILNKIHNNRLYRCQKYVSEADYVQNNWKSENFLFFVKNYRFGVFHGLSIIIPPEYDKLSWKEKGQILIAEQNGETFLIDIKGHRLY